MKFYGYVKMTWRAIGYRLPLFRADQLPAEPDDLAGDSDLIKRRFIRRALTSVVADDARPPAGQQLQPFNDNCVVDADGIYQAGLEARFTPVDHDRIACLDCWLYAVSVHLHQNCIAGGSDKPPEPRLSERVIVF